MEPSEKKRKVISPEARAIIVNVYKFLKEEYIFTMMHKECTCDLSHLENISRRTADATNVTLATLARVLREHRETNTQKKDKVYKFKKSKSCCTTTDAEKIRQELELKETAILAEASDENLIHVKKENVIIESGSVTVKKELDLEIDDKEIETKEYWQPAEVKKEIEEEEIHWELHIKTEVKEEDSTIEDERIG